MARDHAHTGERYRECDLCGFPYRKSELVLNTAGLYVCVHHDVDEGEYVFAPPASALTNDHHAESIWDAVLDSDGKVIGYSSWDAGATHWDAVITPTFIDLYQYSYDTSGNVTGMVLTRYMR